MARKNVRKVRKTKFEWTSLPQRFKEQIIEEYLDLKSKLKFSQCSKSCYAEILGSRNFLKYLIFTETYAKFYEVRYEFYQDQREFHIEFDTLDAEDEDDGALFQVSFYISNHLEDEWELKNIDVLKYTIEYFQRLIDHSTHLKEIEFDFFHTPIYRNIKNIEKLKSLKTFRIYDLRKNRHTLGDSGYENLGLLSKLRKNIICPIPSLNLENLLKITARKSKLYDVKVSPKMAKQFILAVGDGKIDENIKKIRLIYDKNQQVWDPELIFDCDSDSESKNLKVDDFHRDEYALWFDMEIKGKPERYAKFRLTENCLLLVVRLHAKRQIYRQRAEEYVGELGDDGDELRADSYKENPSDFERSTGYGERSDYEF